MATTFDTPNSLFILMVVITILACSYTSFVEAQTWPPQDEVNTLKEIAEQLGKKDWNFSLNPCDGNSNWNTPKMKEMPAYNNAVLCNCSYPGGVCHIETIDLVRNYLHGTIPREWEYMSLENYLFNGSVPAELGKLINLTNLSGLFSIFYRIFQVLFFTSLINEIYVYKTWYCTRFLLIVYCSILNPNYFTGQLPLELTNLTKLVELRLNNNNFTGKLPSFQSWKQLQMFIISDLNGGGSDKFIDAEELSHIREDTCSYSTNE